MRHIFYISISVIFVVFITSCEYKPLGEYEREANENISPPGIEILDLNLEKDTVYLYSGLDVTFRFASSAQKILNVKFSVDGQEAYNSSITNGRIYIDYGKITEGYHNLKLEITTESGSGSIADHLGAEGFLFSNSWVLSVDKNFISKTTGSSFNGRLKLSWPKYRNADFSEYIVTRWLGSGKSVEVGRSVIPEFIDSSYVGEGALYYINVSRSNGTTLLWGFYNLNAELPKLTLYQTADHQYAVKWGSYKYGNAVGSFDLEMSLAWEIYSPLKSTSNYADSIKIIPGLYFGDPVSFNLKIVPAKNNPMNTPDNFYYFETSLKTHAGILFTEANTRLEEELFQVSADEFVSLDRCMFLNRYSVIKKATLQTMTYSSQICSGCEFRLVAASPGGKYLTSTHLCDPNVMMIPSDNLNNFSLHNLASISIYYPVYMSDIGTALVNTSSNGFYIVDMSTNSAIAHYNKTGLNSKGISISPDGNYVLFSDDSVHLVKIEGSIFKNVWKDDLSKLPKFFGFDPTNTEQLAIWDGNVLSTKNCSSFSTINEFPLTDSTLFNIDYYNKEFLSYNPGTPGQLHVRDYANGQLKSEVPVNLDLKSWWVTRVYLFNHYLVCTNGFMDIFK